MLPVPTSRRGRTRGGFAAPAQLLRLFDRQDRTRERPRDVRQRTFVGDADKRVSAETRARCAIRLRFRLLRDPSLVSAILGAFVRNVLPSIVDVRAGSGSRTPTPARNSAVRLISQRQSSFS